MNQATNKPLKILVTGATGFVGSHLCEHLVALGHEVYALIRDQKKAQALKLPGQYIVGDLDPKQQWSWIASLPEELDTVIHTAGLVHSFVHEAFYDTNAKASELLGQVLKQKYPKLHFMLISSLAAAGPSLDLVGNHEAQVAAPTSHYGKSKLMAETQAKIAFTAPYSLTIIRPPMIIGPRDTGVLEIFRMVKSGKVLIPGLDGAQHCYSFVCVYDLVAVIVASLHSQEGSQRLYYSAYKQTITFGELIDFIAQRMQQKRLIKLPIPMLLLSPVAHGLALLQRLFPHQFRLTPDKVQEIRPSRWLCNAGLSETQLGVQYQWDIHRTIDITYQDYKQRGWL